MPRRPRLVLVAGVVAAAAIAGAPPPEQAHVEPVPTTGLPDVASAEPAPSVTSAPEPDPDTLRLAFAGDVHFEGAYRDLPANAESTLGPMSDVLRAADLAMVNLESALTTRGEPAAKELEVPANRYWFRTGPAALDLLGRSGIDVVSVANNHGADFGAVGLSDAVLAGETGGVAVVGAGRTDRQAFAPHRVKVKGTDVAIHAADASRGESADPTWAAAPGTGLGLASARGPGAATLAAAVSESARTDDLVVVYLHWGEEGNACPVETQQNLAATLAAAGADIVVGTHAHTPGGAGLRDRTYVSYGLGNFYWYHGREPDTGVLLLSVRGGEVVGDEWVPGHIAPEGGAPAALTGSARTAAVRDWHELRGCTDLDPGPGAGAADGAAAAAADPAGGPGLPDFASSIQPIGPSVSLAMRSHDPATCPVPLTDLRLLVVTHVGFDGRARRGELVVHADVAADVVDVFAALYAARFPIERMLLVDEYGGDDDRSMAANNTSGYNCRRVAGQTTWSNHAYGRAIDINPVQNPYVVGGDVRPAAALPFLDVDRGPDAAALPGVIRDGDVVRREFERIGWTWGGQFSDPDYQHFSAPGG
ncbi:CapA family protein [Jiangella endophytica]|uniref:CapA family protein n=1 Tax=Jiangella endophytica TaxID=1623398 RepID=UPI0013004A9D|nr:CapA family protein [Jiangella endophytica]